MTSRAFGLISLITGFAIGGEIADWSLLSNLAMGLMTLLVVTGLWARSSLSGVSVVRSVDPARLQVGDVLTDSVTVRSTSQVGKLWIEVRDLARIPGHDGGNVVSLKRKGTSAWSTRSICVRRGAFAIGPMELRSGDPLGVFQRRHKVRAQGEVIVYPPHFELPALRLPFADATGRREIERRAIMATPSVSTVRDYVAGDPLNKISWSITARTGRLMVKEFDLDPTSEIWIIADFSSSANLRAERSVLLDRADRFEFAEAWLDCTEDVVAAIAASVTRLGLDRKRAVGFVGSSAARSILQADTGDRQYHRILGELAVMQSSGREAIADTLIDEVRRFDRNRTPVVISSDADPRWIQALAALRVRGIHPIAIFVDPAAFDRSRETDEIHRVIREQAFPIFTVDFNAGIESAFQLSPPSPVHDHELTIARPV